MTAMFLNNRILRLGFDPNQTASPKPIRSALGHEPVSLAVSECGPLYPQHSP